MAVSCLFKIFHIAVSVSYPYHVKYTCFIDNRIWLMFKCKWKFIILWVLVQESMDFPTKYSQLHREASLLRFRQKRKERCFDKKVRYEVRQEVALRSDNYPIGACILSLTFLLHYMSDSSCEWWLGISFRFCFYKAICW